LFLNLTGSSDHRSFSCERVFVSAARALCNA
jgi:hypothetical protein